MAGKDLSAENRAGAKPFEFPEDIVNMTCDEKHEVADEALEDVAAGFGGTEPFLFKPPGCFQVKGEIEGA
jgi:hypothetical protein